MGLLLPPAAERFARLEETLRIARRMWSADDAAPFEGKYYRLDCPVTSPKPVRQPHPPVLIGGTGERQTLRLVARYADACNLFDIPDGGQTVRRKLSVLAAHCERAGRPYAEIEKTLSTRLQPGESPEALARRCADFAELGIDHVVLLRSGSWDSDRIATLAAAIPAVREIGSAATRS